VKEVADLQHDEVAKDFHAPFLFVGEGISAVDDYI